MSDTRIDPAKFANLSRAKYLTLLYKDLTRLGKKPAIKHDYIYIRRYKFGGQKTDLLLFVDLADKEWLKVPLISCIAGAETKDPEINAFKGRASYGKCKITGVGDIDGDGDDDILITILLAQGDGPAKTKVIQFLDEGLFEGSDVLVRPLIEYKEILQKNGIHFEEDTEDSQLDNIKEVGSTDESDPESSELKSIEVFHDALNEIEKDLAGMKGEAFKEWAKQLFVNNQTSPNKINLSTLIGKLETAVDIGMDCNLTTSVDKYKLAGCKHLLLRLSNLEEELEDEQSLDKGEKNSAIYNALKAIKLTYEEYKKTSKSDHQKRNELIDGILLRIKEFEPHKEKATDQQVNAVVDLKDRLEAEKKGLSGKASAVNLAEAAESDIEKYIEKKRDITMATEVKKLLQEMEVFFNLQSKQAPKNQKEKVEKYKEAIDKVKSELAVLEMFETQMMEYSGIKSESLKERFRFLTGIELGYKDLISEYGFEEVLKNFETKKEEFEVSVLPAYNELQTLLNKKEFDSNDVNKMKNNYRSIYGEVI